MKNNQYKFLRNKWIKKHKSIQEKIVSKHGESLHKISLSSKQIALGSLSSLILLASALHKTPNPLPRAIASSNEPIDLDKKVFLIADLAAKIPENVRPLSEEEEVKISETLSNHFAMKVTAEIKGLRLNRTYGLIGAEQHLARYPGDSMETHFEPPADGGDREKYYSSGMAPGLGAWGYFTTSRANMTEMDVAREKYYIAVQTFLSPDFNNRFAEYRDFFKYRKMLVVNPNNGKAVVAVIGDAGPAEWTGKHLGGSPEVMSYLERKDGKAVGPVLYFFIDDPDDSIPLGPVEPLQ